MSDIAKIKSKVSSLVNKYNTRNPFELADILGVLYQIGNCKNEGCYMFLKNHRYIFLSNKLNSLELKIVIAHELGHALLDRKQNYYFIRNKTLFLNSRFEKRANLFAAHLLIDSEYLKEYSWCTTEQLSHSLGYHLELIYGC